MRTRTLLLVATVGSQLGATECGEIIDDAGFDHWCGDQLCYWTTEKGETRRVPTWREGDDGVELVGDDVAISQLTPVTSDDTDCIRFEMVTDIEETAEVHLEADVFGDGTVDWSERIPTASWKKVSLLIGVEGSYQTIRFRLTKVGDGRAVLARIFAEVADDVTCPSHVDVGARPLGAYCAGPEDCASELCVPNNWITTVCSECDDDTDCTGGEICGLAEDGPAHLAHWRTCVAPAAKQLGELCWGNAECATGQCNSLFCVECGDAVACDDGSTCAPASEELAVDMCGAADGDRLSGEACLVDADCASGACDGDPLGFCDGNSWMPCYEADDCPTYPDLPGECTFVAVAGGTCR